MKTTYGNHFSTLVNRDTVTITSKNTLLLRSVSNANKPIEEVVWDCVMNRLRPVIVQYEFDFRRGGVFGEKAVNK